MLSNITVEVIAGCIVVAIILAACINQLNAMSVVEHINIPVAEASPVGKEVRIEVRVNWTQERIEQELRTVATKYGVSYDKMYNTIKCESNFDIDIQSNHILSYGRENSWGLAQIHLPDHPSVTKEQAINPTFALDFMAKNFAAGRANMWTCYRMLYK